MSKFLFDGVRVIQVDQIEAVEPSEVERVTPAEAYGDRPEVTTVEARVIHMVSGQTYTSEGSFLEIVDLLMELSSGAEHVS